MSVFSKNLLETAQMIIKQFLFIYWQCGVVALVPSLSASLVLDESSPGRRWFFVAFRDLGFNVFNVFCNVLLLHLCLHCLPPYCWMNYPLAGDGFLSPAEVVNRAHRNGVNFLSATILGFGFVCSITGIWATCLGYSSGFGGFGSEYSTSICLGIEIMGTTRLIISVSANCYTKWTDMGG